MRFSLPGIAASCLVVFAACSEGAKSPTAPVAGAPGATAQNATTTGTTVASVSVSPTTATVNVGATTPLSATVKDSYGRTISGASITWESTNWNVAAVTASGVVTGRTAGTATISASSGGRTGTATVTVKATGGSVASVALSPASGSIAAIGGTLQLTATMKDSAGNVLTGHAASWDSGDWNIAWVNASGLVTAKANGTVVIKITSEGRTATATITVGSSTTPTAAPVASIAVTPKSLALGTGQTAQLTASTKDSAGNTLGGRAITWMSSNTAVATVSSTGLVTAKAVGTATIKVTSEGKTTAVSVSVTQAPVATVSVTANASSLTVGQSTQATAVTKDASGATLTGRTVTWSSSNATVASVSASGLVTANAAGSAVITATSEGKSGSVTIAVSAPAPAPVATVAVSPSSATLSVGGTQQLAATTKDASGNVLTGRTVTWSSSNTSVARVSSAGLVTAVASGNATITATSEGRTGSAAVTVTPSSQGGSGGTVSSCPLPNLRANLSYDSGKIDSLDAQEGWYLYSPYHYKVVQDPTARGGWSFENDFTYNPGGDQGTAVEGVFARHTQQKVFMRMRYKQDPSFDNSGIKKLMRVQGSQGLVGGIAAMWGQFYLGLDALTDGVNRGINVGPMVTPDDLKGSWHTYEFMADFSTAGHLKYRFWIDGQLKMDYDIPKSSNGANIYLAMFDGTWNAPGGTTKSWMDDNAVSTECIGLQ